ncbi:MAG: hypothetical protein AcusKO_43920 [Acuticoccus sp.]
MPAPLPTCHQEDLTILAKKQSYPLEAMADLPGLSFAPMRAMVLAEAGRHGLPVVEDDPGRLTVRTAHGLVGLRDGEGAAGVAAMVAAADARWLFILKDGLVTQLAQAMPEAAQGLRWSDAAAGGTPPNFQFARVVSVEPLGSAFLRVQLFPEDLSRFGDEAIHFRLVLAPPGLADVAWPSVGANGAVVWPSGDKALHRPVYTTRRIDRAARLMEFDIFLHEGGRVSDWARGATARTVVGLTGPGGGGIPDTTCIVMFADETGFPAVARILEALPAGTEGEVTLLAEAGAACGYPMAPPPGVVLRWLSPRDGLALDVAAMEAHRAHPDHFLWFAGERTAAMAARAGFKAAGGDPARAYISAYWRAPYSAAAS